jgi:hypothetical protein
VRISLRSKPLLGRGGRQFRCTDMELTGILHIYDSASNVLPMHKSLP